jgi:hypothetical protein
MVKVLNSSMIYLLYCKNLCKWHNVPLPNTTIKTGCWWLIPVILATQEDQSSKPSRAHSSARLYLEKLFTKNRAGGVGQGISSEFKPQYCKKQKPENKTKQKKPFLTAKTKCYSHSPSFSHMLFSFSYFLLPNFCTCSFLLVECHSFPFTAIGDLFLTLITQSSSLISFCWLYTYHCPQWQDVDFQAFSEAVAVALFLWKIVKWYFAYSAANDVWDVFQREPCHTALTT